jgi:hypothetical protein
MLGLLIVMPVTERAPVSSASLSALIRAAAARLRAAGFRVHRDEDTLQIWLSQDRIEAEADRLRLVVRSINNPFPRTPDASHEQIDRLDAFSLLHRDWFVANADGDDASPAFTAAQKVFLVHSALRCVTTGVQVARLLASAVVASDTSLIESGCIAKVAPLHDAEQQRRVWRLCAAHWFTDPVRAIYDYYGDDAATYFSFMQSFTLWLFIPAAIGTPLWLHGWLSGVSVEDSALLPFFGLAVIVWSHTFLKAWERHMSVLSFSWGLSAETNDTYNTGGGDHELPPAETTAHRRQRWLWYAISSITTTAMLAVAIVTMIVSFNLQGYMSDPESVLHVPAVHRFSDPGSIFDPNGPSWLLPLVPVLLHSALIMQLNGVYSSIAEWLTEKEAHATAGATQNALILKRVFFESCDCYLPLFYLAFYELDVRLLRLELVALFTTDSLRRVVTESVLPYVARRLREWTTSRVDAKHKKHDGDASGGDDDADDDTDDADGAGMLTDAASVRQQLTAEEAETFDDYLEMCIEFGYVTLFASSFPLAALLSIVCNLVETRSDAFKLSFVTRRPLLRRRVGREEGRNLMGAWLPVLRALAWLGVLTNVAIFGLASEQMVQFWPSLFQCTGANANAAGAAPVFEGGNLHHESDFVFAEGQGRFVIGIVFALEHALLALCLLIAFAVSPLPSWLQRVVVVDRHERRNQRYTLLAEDPADGGNRQSKTVKVTSS